MSARPLWIPPSANKWCDILMAKKAGLVNRHDHPHEVGKMGCRADAMERLMR